MSLLLLKLKDEGMSILVSSHILSELDEYCSHMLVIKGGRVQAFQSVNDDVNEDQTVSLQFVGLDESIFERVRNTEGVKQAEWNNHAVIVILDAGEEARAALLRKLFEQNLPLSEAAVIKASLLNSYQNSVFRSAVFWGYAKGGSAGCERRGACPCEAVLSLSGSSIRARHLFGRFPAGPRRADAELVFMVGRTHAPF